MGENKLIDNRDANINLPLVAAIVGVATIGGFMFGYDSGVINGTQDGLRSTFDLSEAWLGITVSALLPGCAVGAFLAGRLADRLGPAPGHGGGGGAVHFQRARLGRGGLGAHDDRRAICRRRGRGGGQRAVARIYQRGDAGEHARPLVERAADHDHRRTDRRVSRQLFPGARRRQVHRCVVAWVCGLALDVLDADHPGERVLADPAAHPGKPAIPGGARPQ